MAGACMSRCRVPAWALTAAWGAADDEKLRMYVGYSTKVDTKCVGVWSIPHRRCSPTPITLAP